MKMTMTFLLAIAVAAQTRAQDDNEFQRIATRVMTSYENGNDTIREYHKNANFTGRAFLGTSTRGNAMPSGSFTLKSDRWLFTGDVSADLGRHNTLQDIDTKALSGTSDRTESKIEEKFENVNASLRFDYKPHQHDIFSIGVLETFKHTASEVNSVKYAYDEQHNDMGEEYEEQVRNVKDTKVGSLLQYKRLMPAGASFTARANIRYFNQRTTLESEEWAVGAFDDIDSETQRLNNFSPYLFMDYTSPIWHGFSFVANEKLNLSNLHIEDTKTQFDFDSRAALTTLSLRYQINKLTMKAGVDYEFYHYLIHDGYNADITRNHNDWQANFSLTYQVSKNHRLRANFERNYKRPEYTELYPFVHIGRNIGVWVVGNPQLEPSTSNYYKFDYTYNSKHWTASLRTEYSQKKDDITRISLYDETLHQSIKTWVNDANYRTLQLALEGEMRYGIFSMTMGARAKRLSYDGEKVKNDEAWSYSFKARPQFKLRNNWTLALTALYTGKEVHRYYYERPYTYISLRAVKEFGPWGIYAFVQDVFEDDRSNVTMNTDNTIVTTNHLNARSLIVGCSYTF